MQKIYDRLSKDNKFLNENITNVHEQLYSVTDLLSSPKSQFKLLTPQNSPGNLVDVYQINLEKIENAVNSYDQNLRRLFNEAKQLEDDYFPNIDILNDR
jgi:hypothetical protein